MGMVPRTVWISASGEHGEPVLGEVTVEGEGVGNPQAVHHREAGGVGEREILVIILADDLAGSTFVPAADADEGCGAVVQLPQDPGSNGTSTAGEEERVGLGDDEIGSEEMG